MTTLFFLTAAAAAPLARTRVCELSRKTARAGLAGGGGRLPKGALLPCVGQSTVSTIGIMGAQGAPPLPWHPHPRLVTHPHLTTTARGREHGDEAPGPELLLGQCHCADWTLETRSLGPCRPSLLD